ncbi:hypothetical protein HNY73_014484 [Argiope bruennichi]|uniref:Uncharacterized protein n=1 Tax=Argiope bruennichi TaxID=94029 RepID=A0A8T0EPD9_ARGBR|nr:hypothetical protein HNY73_014484 [Argiope bruennichi]
MEPCELDIENAVFPKKFKYKVLKKRKIDSQNFECELRIALNDYDDVKEWFKHFKGNTNTEWLLRQSTTCEENVLNQLYVCQNSSFGKKRKFDDDEGTKLDFNCKAAISVKIKKGGKRTYYQDEYVKRGYKGMSPSEAIRNHEEILLLEGHEDLGNSRKNPSEEWVYSLYEEWTKEIENRLQLESQLTRASVFWRLQNRPTQPPNNSKSKNIVKLCKFAEDINGMQIPADLHVSDNDDDDDDNDDDDEDSDSENQYDSYDEDSSPQVSSSYMSVNTASHQATASCAPLKLNVPNNINITRGCTLQVIKNNNGGKKSNSGGRIIVEAIGKSTNSSQGNSVQIITTSHEDNKKSVFKVLTVTANSRKYTNLELGKTFRIVNTPKVNRRSVKDDNVIINSKECQNVSKSLPKCENATKVNSIPFIKNSDEDNLKTSTNMKPVFVRVQKGDGDEEASSLVKCHKAQKDTETVLQHALTKFKNSDNKNDNIPYKNKQAFQGNKVACPRSDIHDESMKPVLKNCVQNFVRSPLSENVSDTNIVLKNGQNQGIKNDSYCPKQVSRNVSNNIQQGPVKRVITVTRYSVSSHSGNPSNNKKRDKNDLKNNDQQKDNKSIQFPDSEMLFQNREQQFENLEKLNNTNKITPKSTNDSFDNCNISSLVPKNYCDNAQSCSSSSLESLPQVLLESGSVQSITNPISSVVQGLGLSKPMLFDNVPNLPKHDAVVTSSSALCHEDLLSDVHHESAFQNSSYLERLPIQGCPFPLPEDLDRTSAVEKSSYMGIQGGGDSQMFPLPFSKDLYDSVEKNDTQIPVNQDESDDSNHSLMLSETFCNNNDPPYIPENSGNHSISNDLSYSLHDPDFIVSCNDINSSQLPAGLDISNEDSLQNMFPDLRKLENELNNFNFEFPTIPNHEPMDLCSSQASVGNQLSLLNTCTNSLPELQVNPLSLFGNSEDNILPIPENLKGNIEDIDILKNILNIKCNKLENSELEEFFQQPEYHNHKEILEKWDSEMYRLRSLLEQNVHDGRLMREANQFLERIKESIVTPSELAIFFSSACSLESQKEKH